MTYAQYALRAALIADTLSATLLSGCTTTVLKVADASPWAQDDWINLTGTGATLANHRVSRRIVAVDTALDTLQLDHALSVAPAAGDTIGGGYVQWVLSAAAANEDTLYYVARDDKHPALNLLAGDKTERRCVVVYGEISSGREVMSSDEERWRFRVFSLYDSWAKACAARIRKKLDGNPGFLTVAGRRVVSVEAMDAVPVMRTDELVEKHLPVYLCTSRAA